MSKLTTQYIDDHINGVHNFDSFGRAIAELCLRAAMNKAGDPKTATKGDTMSLTAEVNVSAIKPQGCVGVEICVPFAGCSRVHVNVG